MARKKVVHEEHEEEEIEDGLQEAPEETEAEKVVEEPAVVYPLGKGSTPSQ